MNIRAHAVVASEGHSATAGMLIKIRNDLYVGRGSGWCLRKVEDVWLVKCKLLTIHITVLDCDMTGNAAGMTVTAM